MYIHCWPCAYSNAPVWAYSKLRDTLKSPKDKYALLTTPCVGSHWGAHEWIHLEVWNRPSGWNSHGTCSSHGPQGCKLWATLYVHVWVFWRAYVTASTHVPIATWQLVYVPIWTVHRTATAAAMSQLDNLILATCVPPTPSNQLSEGDQPWFLSGWRYWRP